MNDRRWYCRAALGALALIASCKIGIGDKTTGPGGGTAIARVDVSPSIQSIEVGQTVQFQATLYDSAGSVISPASVTWSSDCPSCATVDASGKATGVSVTPAQFAIRATATNGKSGAGALTVAAQGPALTLAISPTSATLGIGQSVQLSAVVKDLAGVVLQNPAITWVSSDTAVSTVSTTGVVTGIATGGPVTITATDGAAHGSDAVMVQRVALATELFGLSFCGNTGFAVGAGGRILYYDGTTWQQQTSGTSADLHAVTYSCNGVPHALAVGAAGTILQFNGTSWSPLVSGTTANLHGVDRSGAQQWAAGASGVIRFFSAGAWTASTSGSTNDIPWISSANNVPNADAVALSGGSVLLHSGSAWSALPTGATQPLYAAVALDSGAKVFAVGAGGTIRRSAVTSLSSWSAVTSGTTNDLLDVVHTSGTGDVFVVGAGGTILHYNGTTWSTQTSPTTVRLNAVDGWSATDVWAVGVGGVILHYDGSSWRSANGPPPAPVATVTVSPPTASFAVGQTIPLTAYTFDAGGTRLFGRTVSWASSDSTIARVDAGTGVVTALRLAGPVTITATSEGKSGSGSISVTSLTFASVTVGVAFTCALTPAGAAYCWGDNTAGQLGLGSADTTAHPTPAPVVGGYTFTALAAGGASHTCGLVAGGTMYCWGDNSFGQLGTGIVDLVPHPAPTAVTGAHSFASLLTNGPYTCALDMSGAAWCWGDGTYGTLGSAAAQSATPVAVSGGLTFTSIAGGTYHVCGTTSGGTAYCWGRNQAGQLGIGSTDSASHPTPTAVVGGVIFTALVGGANYSCGLASTTGYCWGGNAFGALGRGTPGRDSVPDLIAGGLSWSSLTAARTTCGVTTGGAGYCWGDNESGEMGIGSIDVLSHNSPEAVTGGLSFLSIHANRALDTCGIATTGVLYCWGLNSRGELGIGTTGVVDVPVKVLTQP